MADVYRAHHTRLDRDVAIKVLHPHLIEGQDFLARFEREARAVASLKHPHIVQVFDFDSQDDLHYLVMELIDGGSLRGRLGELAQCGAHLSLDEVLRIFGHVASALDHAHGHGMPHRDVKPANVLLDREGNAYLSDFGIARILSQTQFTTTGALIGTPHYMSPEQGKGEPLTEAADLYSLGVVLYEMMTGRLPYDADTPMGVIHKHLSEPLPAPRSVRPDLPADVDGLMGKALSKDPAGRFASGEEMRHALERALTPATAPPGRRPRPASADTTSARAPQAGESPKAEDKQLTITSVPTMAPGPGRPPSATPAKPTRPRWIPFVMGAVAVAVVGTALAVTLPRILEQGPATSADSRARHTEIATQAPITATATRSAGGCLTLAECITQAEAAKRAGRYQEAVDTYLRAQSFRDSGQQAYAYLHCDLAETYLRMDQTELALASYRHCSDVTAPSPSFRDLRIKAQTAIASIRGGAFAERYTELGRGEGASALCSQPAHALGAPDFSAVDPGTYLCLGRMGDMTLAFVYNLVADGPGADLRIHGDPDNDDTWQVDVSDGDTWLTFGPQPECVDLDLAEVGLLRVRFIHLRDTGQGNNGAELDAVEALNWEPAG